MLYLTNSTWLEGVQYRWTVDVRGAIGIVAFDLKKEHTEFPVIEDVDAALATVTLERGIVLQLPQRVWWMEDALQRWAAIKNDLVFP